MKGFKAIVLCAAAAAVVGCNHGASSYSILGSGQTFYQNSSNQDTKIDVLWVIDNSGSMATSQKNLADNFGSFIQSFSANRYDFQMGVTTTQAYLADSIWTPFYNTKPTPYYYEGQSQDMIAKFRDGQNPSDGGIGHSGFFLLNPSTPNLNQKFVINAIQGTTGNGDERSLDSMKAALESPWNSAFLRNGSFLAVVIVTDEDDFSNPTTKHYERYDAPLTPLTDFVSYLDGKTRSTDKLKHYSVSTIAVPDTKCLNKIYNGAQKVGDRVNKMADLTGGIKGNICGNFADELDLIAKEIVKLANQFDLGDAKPLPESIRVSINGNPVPKADANPSNDGGWTYNPDANSIVFTGTWIPPQGAAVNVTFDPASAM